MSIADIAKTRERVKKLAKGNTEKKKDEPKKEEVSVWKYSLDGMLYESVILRGKPAFILYKEDTNALIEESKLENEVYSFKPSYASPKETLSYHFATPEELYEYLQRAKGETIDNLYRQVKACIIKFNDIDEQTASLLACDVIFTYFQDKIGTTHYVLLWGLPETGKGSILATFKQLGYRCLLTGSATPASIFRELGFIEPGQITLLLDEVNNLDQYVEFQEILKEGYVSDATIPRVLDASSSARPTQFFPFCFKILATENRPTDEKSLGFRTRCFEINTFVGVPKLKIRNVTNHDNEPTLLREYEKIMDLRKLLFAYRLVNYRKTIPSIKLNINGRAEELSAPILRLFHNTPVFNEIKDTLSKFVDERQKARVEGFEAYLYNMIRAMRNEQGLEWQTSETSEIPFSELWGNIFGDLEAEEVPNNKNSMETSKFGKISKRKITLTAKKFGCEPFLSAEHERVSMLKISNERFRRFESMYDVKDSIEVVASDASDASDVQRAETVENKENSDNLSVNLPLNQSKEPPLTLDRSLASLASLAN